MQLTQASRQWASRPDDERFTNLFDMLDHFRAVRQYSREAVVSSRRISAVPVGDDQNGIEIFGPNGVGYAPTNWAFGQLATLAEAPAGYLRKLPAPIAADCLNYGFKFTRQIEDVGVLLQKNGDSVLRAATGPRYGRIWNHDIIAGLVDRFGDGITGDFRVPGEFGKAVVVDKGNTTLYASDRDCFVFLADEEHRVTIPNRRNGQPGDMARGFFVWNSEVGAATLGIATFLFDYVCCNRIVWGASEYKEIKIRHTAAAPDRWLDEVAPAIKLYAESSTMGITQAVENARNARLTDDTLKTFLAERFSKGMAKELCEVHMAEENRPIESLWDVTTALTAHARTLPHQDARVALERQAGEIMALAE